MSHVQDPELMQLGLEVFDQFVTAKQDDDQPIAVSMLNVALGLCRKVMRSLLLGLKALTVLGVGRRSSPRPTAGQGHARACHW